MAFCKACPRNFMNGRKKPGAKSFSVSLDLTKRGYILLTKAKGLRKDTPDINTYKYYNSEKNLRRYSNYNCLFLF